MNGLSGDVYSARVRRSKTEKYEFENARISNAVFSQCDKLRKPPFPVDGHICILFIRLLKMSRQILEQIATEELFNTRCCNPEIFISCAKRKGNATYIRQLQAGNGDRVTC